MANPWAFSATTAALVLLVASGSVAASTTTVVALDDGRLPAWAAGPCSPRTPIVALAVESAQSPACRPSCPRATDSIARLTPDASVYVTSCCKGSASPNGCLVVVIRGSVGEHSYCIYVATGPGPNPCS